MADTDLFFSRTGMDRGKVQETVDTALKGADDGELFLEYSQSESFSFDDGRLKAATFDTSQGFGLRAVAGEATGYAHATELSEDAIARAARTVKAVASGHSGTAAGGPARSNIKLYTDLDPLQTAGFEKKSTPMPGPRTAGCIRCRPLCPANGSMSRSCGRAASITPTRGRWCGSMCP
jgi:TldD protein